MVFSSGKIITKFSFFLNIKPRSWEKVVEQMSSWWERIVLVVRLVIIYSTSTPGFPGRALRALAWLLCSAGTMRIGAPNSF